MKKKLITIFLLEKLKIKKFIIFFLITKYKNY